MEYTPYRDVGYKIRTRMAFQGNSASAVMEHNAYEVYSYGTLIARLNGSAITYLDNSYYSRTTSRLQRIIRSLIIGQAEKIMDYTVYNNCLLLTVTG